jgi:Stress responsive A/B Barrel Domain
MRWRVGARKGEGKSMIKHVVFFKFRPELKSHEREPLLRDLRALPDRIDFIRGFEVGTDLLGSPRSWDGVLIAEFDDLGSLEAYSRHADHVPIALRMKDACDAVGSVDYEV